MKIQRRIALTMDVAPITVTAADGGKSSCATVVKNLVWKCQG